jgi:hypothetical protein
MAQPRKEYFEEVRRQLIACTKGEVLNPAAQTLNPGAPEERTCDSAVATRRRGKRNRNIRLRMHNIEMSILEGVMARGDRRLGPAIHEAWKRGARFDGWSEMFDNSIWQDAFATAGVDPDFYAHRERGFDEILPWDHIGLRIGRPFLEKGYNDVFEQIGMTKPPVGLTNTLPVVDG